MSIARTSLSSLFAIAFTTLGSVLMATTTTSSGTTDASILEVQPSAELEGLLDADAAARLGSWWLDEVSTHARLTFDPHHDRLVWQVSGVEGRVVLDAETGEALAFEWV